MSMTRMAPKSQRIYRLNVLSVKNMYIKDKMDAQHIQKIHFLT